MQRQLERDQVKEKGPCFVFLGVLAPRAAQAPVVWRGVLYDWVGGYVLASAFNRVGRERRRRGQRLPFEWCAERRRRNKLNIASSLSADEVYKSRLSDDGLSATGKPSEPE